jgi:hypothetical protein
MEDISLVNAFENIESIDTKEVSNAYYYTSEDLRILLLKELYKKGFKVEKLCIELEISYDMIYKIRKGTRHIPASILDRLGMYKVCDRQYTVGYVKIGSDIDWTNLWASGLCTREV